MEKLKIYYTTDVHGFILPEGKGSFLQCVENFQIDGNTLVLDGGDSIQGAPLVKYLNQAGLLGKVMGTAFQLGGYHYFTLGNHDFNYGYTGVAQYLQEMTATCLCANVQDKSGVLPILSYEIRTMANGLRVGITGAVTEFVSFYEGEERLAPLVVGETFPALKSTLQEMKGLCDVTICIYHGGFEEDLDTGEVLFHSRENIGAEICRELDFDILLTGHQHQVREGRYYHGTYIIAPPEHGMGYAEINVDYALPISLDGEGTLGISSQIKMPSQTVTEDVYDKFLQIKEQGEEWLSQEISTLPQEYATIDKITQAMEGSIFADLLNFLQMDATGAEISAISLPNRELYLGKSVTVKAILEAVPYANGVVVLEVTGAKLLAMIQKTASYFRWTAEKAVVDSRFLQPKECHYQYEYFANIGYYVKLSPFGENHVEDVTVLGEPLDLGKVYRLAVSEYRASGVGGYEFLQDCPKVMVVDEDIQDLALKFFSQGGKLDLIPRYQDITLV